MAVKSAPFKNYPTWTESRFWQYIRSALRSSSNRYPVKYTVKNKARKPYKGPDKRTKWVYQCNECKNWFKGNETQVDHIKGHLTLKDYSDLPKFVEELFCSEDDLQVLCKECHRAKGVVEKQERKERNGA